MLSSSGASRAQSRGSTWALKKINSTSDGGVAGVAISYPFEQALHDDVSVPGESEVLWTFKTPSNEGAWIVRTAYRFNIKHRPDEKTIQVMLWEAGNLLIDSKVTDTTDSPLNGGRLGVFCFSQARVTFSALSYR